MVLTIPLFAGMGACIGLMGGVLGGMEPDQWATLSDAHRANLKTGARRRSLAIGAVASGILICFAYFDGAAQVAHRLALICITVSFVLSSLYVAGWLRLVAEFGSSPVEAGELALAVVLVALGLLYISGILWITLLVLVGTLVTAAGIWGGLHFLRLAERLSRIQLTGLELFQLRS